MKIRDRVKKLVRVKASELRPNPKNWRTHPTAQADALKGLLAELGSATAVYARELEDGSLMLIDGHLRAETLGDEVVSVLVLDVNEAEADKLLATLDPLAAMAETNAALLDELLRNVETGSEAVSQMLADLADDAGLYQTEAKDTAEASFNYQQQYAVTVVCRDEAHQKEVYDSLVEQGHECKVVVV